MNPNIEILKESYFEVLKDFCKKHDLERTHFTNNDWTSYCYFGVHYFFTMEDIIRDILNNNSPNEITKWFDNRGIFGVETHTFQEFNNLKDLKEPL